MFFSELDIDRHRRWTLTDIDADGNIDVDVNADARADVEADVVNYRAAVSAFAKGQR